ncbi:hypothetical protein NM688_g1194 [Phlebia brevispora]|uniref:Uncharacterized protein n=1 Tax=Phlebia brevispora TaxID=194682 RepID=A0ACC1TCF6_9APHY|nr:hypothetical protein NM688_g1194 [Phlebia brevispora]
MRTLEKQPYMLNESFIQTGSYALETLACTFRTRLFCVNVLMRSDRIYYWYYDACGFIYTSSISFIEDFAKAAAIVVGMACATPEQLGALPSIITPPLDAPYPANWPPENLNRHTVILPQIPTYPGSKTTRDVHATLQESVFSQYILAGRRTFVYTVKTEPPLSESEHIIKIYYQVHCRKKEHELLNLARDAGIGKFF